LLKTTKVLLIGCGAVAQRLYSKPLQRLERQGMVHVVGLVDVHQAHARALGSSCREASLYDQPETALQATKPDLTLVLSPAHLHANHAMLAFKSNSHVLCEKPMATNVDDCSRMIDAAQETDRVLAVGMIRRFFPAFRRLKQWIESGRLGTVESFQYREGRRFDWDVATPAGFLKRAEGGSGVFFDIGPHAIDLLLWLFGDFTPTFYADDALAGVESHVLMRMETACGPGLLQLCWDFPLANELRVFGTQGEAVLRTDQLDKLAIKQSSRFEQVECDDACPADLEQPSRQTVSPKLYTQAVYCQLVQTIRAIRLGEAPAATGEDGRRCVAIIDAARRMAQPLEMPWLDAKRREANEALHWTNS
jgi:predicted dehydrogenase